MMRMLLRCAPWVLAIAVAGCGASGVNGGSPSPTAPSPTPSPSAPSPSPSPSPSPAPAGCALGLEHLPASIPPRGGTFEFNVVIGAGCQWSGRTDATWADIEPSSSVGPELMRLQVAESTQVDRRTVTITLNGQAFAVVQDGNPCVYTISASSFNAPDQGAQFQVRVTTQAGCRWTASSSASWITMQTASGTGADWAYFLVAANTGDVRQGVVTIAGQRVTITQARG